jgi:type VI secretion system protein ImpF
MANDSQPIGFLPSILDRLIDPDSAGTLARTGYGLNEMIDAVRRDLEELLNTRRGQPVPPERYPELSRSVFSYGLPDLVTTPAATLQQREALARLLEQIVTLHEPRIRNVRATVTGDIDGKDRAIRFRLEGQLRVEPAPDVEFETVLELSSGHSQVKSQVNATQ